MALDSTKAFDSYTFWLNGHHATYYFQDRELYQGPAASGSAMTAVPRNVAGKLPPAVIRALAASRRLTFLTDAQQATVAADPDGRLPGAAGA